MEDQIRQAFSQSAAVGMDQILHVARTFHYVGVMQLAFECVMQLFVLALVLVPVALVARSRAESTSEFFARFNAGALLETWAMFCNNRRFQVGTPKVAMISMFGSTRSILDVVAHIGCVVSLLDVLFRHTAQRRSSLIASVCLMVICLSDPLCIGNWLITPLVLMALWGCCTISQGSLAGKQVVIILLMSGTGLGKVGPHSDMHGTPGFSVVVGSLVPAWGDLFWPQQRDDIRPSLFAGIVGQTLVSMEVLVPLVLLVGSEKVVKLAIALLLVMHAAIFLVVRQVMPLAYLQVWCGAAWICLFLSGDSDRPAYRFDHLGLKSMPVVLKIATFSFVFFNLFSQLMPEIDWHPLLRYTHFGAGNQPCCHPVLVKRAALPNIRSHIPFPQATWEESDETGAAVELSIRWFQELNHRGSGALLDYARGLCGGDWGDYHLIMYSDFVRSLAGASSDTMNNYDRVFFEQLVRMGFLEYCDVTLIWMGPVSRPWFPFMHRISRWSLWDGKLGLLKSWDVPAQELRSMEKPSAAARVMDDARFAAWSPSARLIATPSNNGSFATESLSESTVTSRQTVTEL